MHHLLRQNSSSEIGSFLFLDSAFPRDASHCLWMQTLLPQKMMHRHAPVWFRLKSRPRVEGFGTYSPFVLTSIKAKCAQIFKFDEMMKFIYVISQFWYLVGTNTKALHLQVSLSGSVLTSIKAKCMYIFRFDEMMNASRPRTFGSYVVCVEISPKIRYATSSNITAVRGMEKYYFFQHLLPQIKDLRSKMGLTFIIQHFLRRI